MKFKLGDRVRIKTKPKALLKKWAIERVSGMDGTIVDGEHTTRIQKAVKVTDDKFEWYVPVELLEKVSE